MNKPPAPMIYVLCFMLVLAVLPLPYGYYQLLRLAATVGFVWLAISAFNNNLQGWAVGAGLLALLYNPIIPVHLTREIWLPINLISAAVAFLSSRSIDATEITEEQGIQNTDNQ